MAVLDPRLLRVLGFNPSGDLGPFTIYRSVRHRLVWFARTRPDKPASFLQRRHRNRFRLAARVWRSLQPAERTNWLAAARLARLTVSGYNLFIYYQLTADRTAIGTIQRLTGLTLL